MLTLEKKVTLNLQDSENGNEISGNNRDEQRKAWHDASKMLWHVKKVETKLRLIICMI